jgi:very-short-patch-repair endonuclease
MILPYDNALKPNSRALRSRMTDAEQKLWQCLRRKQINGWQFYRQKPLGPYIVDFYCAAARLVVELDGSQHFEAEHRESDRQRDEYLRGLGLTVLRFDNRQVLLETGAVLEVIRRIPPGPPFSKGGDGCVVQVSESGQTTAANLVFSVDHCAANPTPPLEKCAAESIPSFEKTHDPNFSFEEGHDPILPFEKAHDPNFPCEKRHDPIPPFEKGGLGGIHQNKRPTTKRKS